MELSACFEVGFLVVLRSGNFCVVGAGVGWWSYWEGGGEKVVWCEEALGDALEGLFFDGEEARFVEGVFVCYVEELEGRHFEVLRARECCCIVVVYKLVMVAQNGRVCGCTEVCVLCCGLFIVLLKLRTRYALARLSQAVCRG